MTQDSRNPVPTKEDRPRRLVARPMDFVRDKPPKNMPRAVWIAIVPWGLTCRFTLIFAVPAAAVLGAILLDSFGLIDFPFLQPMTHHAPLYISIAILPLSLLNNYLPHIAIKRYLRRVDKHNGELCLTCGYHLTGLPTEHRCPECGTEYNLAETRETWRKIILSNLKPPRRREKEDTP